MHVLTKKQKKLLRRILGKCKRILKRMLVRKA